MSDQVLGNSGGAEGAREDRGPSCSPCVPLPARRSPSEHRPSQEVRGDAERRLVGGSPARREPEVQSPESVYPRFVTPGIETQNLPNQVPEPGISCRPDWIRLVGPESQTNWLLKRLRTAYGDFIPHNGAKYFRAGALWHPGILLSWGHKSDIVMIDLQGSRLACTPVDEFMQLTSDILMHGFHCTRIDLAVDHVGMGLGLHKLALASCKAGELCKLRTYADDSEFKVDGTPQRYLLKLGKRDSPVCIRFYDKGLEIKTMSPGQWERLEVEFKNDRAHVVCISLAQAGEQLCDQLWRYVIGALDFRVVNGRTELNRRPRALWWSQYVGQSHPLETIPIRKNSSFATWCDWFQSAVAPRLIQFANILEVEPHELFRDIIVDICAADTITPAVLEVANMMESKKS